MKSALSKLKGLRKMAKKADRYTLFKVDFEEVSELLKTVSELGMYWHCARPATGDSNEVDIFVFFDHAGMENHLSGVYDNVADLIRRIIRRNKNNDLTAAEALAEIAEVLNF